MNHLIAQAFGRAMVVLHIAFAALYGYLLIEIHSVVRFIGLEPTAVAQVTIAAGLFVAYLLIAGSISTLVSINGYLNELCELKRGESLNQPQAVEDLLKYQKRQTLNSELLVDFVRETVATQQLESSQKRSAKGSVVKLPEGK